jgi:pentatricopeptide repeat protein
MRFKDTQLSIPEISKVLHVDAFVEGSVIREANHIRVIAQLIRANDQHFWSETYDRDLTDVLALQSDITHAIAARVEATISGRENERIVAAHAVSPDVYDSYLKGRFALETKANTRAGVEESIRYFEEAISKDPKFAPAYVGLAAGRSELGLVRMGGRPGARQQVVEAARKALELDPDLSEAHVLLAGIARQNWNWAEAQAEYRKALEVNPSDADAYAGYAWWLACHGRFDEAIQWAERGRELDQLGISGNSLAWIFFNARRYDDAIRVLRGLLDVQPDDIQALWNLGFTLVVKGQSQQAIPLLEKASALSGHSSGVIDLLAAAYARAGRREDALRLIAEMKRRSQTDYVPATAFVIAYIGVGNYQQAFVWLDQAYKEKSNILQFVKVHPFLDPLRSDPRFPDLVRRVGLD